MKLLKYAFYAIAGLLTVAVVAGIVFALTFDPNRYKDDIERLVKERTGRTLALRGDLEVAFWPSLGAKVAGVTLSERASEAEFASLDNAHASVALLPLLRGEVIVDGVRVSGLKAQVIRRKDGTYNFSDLVPQAEEGKGKPAAGASKPADAGEAVQFDIAGVEIEGAAVSYRDLASGQELALSEIHLDTGRIAERAEGKLELALQATGRKPDLAASLSVDGRYRYDLAAKALALSEFFLDLKGRYEKDDIEARIDAPRIDIAADRAQGEALTAQFMLKGEQRSAEAVLRLAGIEGSAKALAVPQFTADLALASPDLPQKTLKVPLSGSLRADLEKQTASAEVQGKIDESNIKATLGLASFTPARYRFDVAIDQLNLDRYLPPEKPAAQPKGGDKGGGKGAGPADTKTPVDLSALEGLDASGRVQLGALQARGLKLSEVKAEMRAANGRMEVAPHSARLYEGALAGALTLQAAGNRVTVKEKLSGVSIGPLLRDAADVDRLEGRGDVSLDVAAAGATVEAMKRALNGSARVYLRDGAIKGINIAEVLRKAKSALGASGETQAAAGPEKTDFSELSASFVIRNGVARNDDLDVKAPLFRITGRGEIDVGRSTVDYTTKVAVVASAKGQGGAELSELAGITVPVQLTGPFEDLKYKVDYGAVAADLAKSKAGAKVKERVNERREDIEKQLEERLGDKLKGLLGR